MQEVQPILCVGNLNPDTAAYSLACMLCGMQTGIVLHAHRNESQHITGFIAVCSLCSENIDNVNLMVSYGQNGEEATKEVPE